MDLVSLYLKGEVQQVWKQINEVNFKVEEIETVLEIEATLDLAMKKVSENIQSIISNLEKIGYEFEFEQKYSIGHISRFSLAASETKGRISKFEVEYGCLPLTLKAFYSNVDTVCLIGSYPEHWEFIEGGDPLVIWPSDSVLDDFEASFLSKGDEKQLHEVSISPCFLAKEGTSGGSPYCLDLPASSIDFIVKYERHGFNFIDYLRRVFFWGGFPGFDFEKKTPPLSDIQFLKKDLVEF